eukprot:m.18245 g.18245  ORF g.18245 m.18245 type:complete len:134 (+) comp7749_c0_seq1:107-508(+)
MEELVAQLEATPVINYEQLSSMAWIPDLYDTTVATVQEKISAMQAIRYQPQLTLNDLHALGDLGHGLKSGTCMIGCARLELLCSKIELFGRHGEAQNSDALFYLYDNFMAPIVQETMQELYHALQMAQQQQPQ